MYCRECGKEIADGSDFCGLCGADLRGAAQAAGQAPAPPGPQAYTPPPPPAGAPPGEPGGYAQPPKKSPLPWILGGIGVLAVIAIVLVLVFVVFGGGGTSDTSGPEQVVNDFYTALEKGDVDMLIATMEPSFRSELEDALGKKYDQYLEDYFFAYFPEDMEVDIRKMETKIDGDTATVTVMDGTVTYTDESGKEVSEEASEGDSEPLQLVRVDGKWYLAGDYLKESGFDPEELAALSDSGDILDDGTGSEDGTSTGDGDQAAQLAEVEEAMLDYAYANLPDEYELAIIALAIKGKEAVGYAHFVNQELDDVWITMKKGSSGWYGVDWATDLELPAWYETEEAEVEEAMIAYTKEHAAEELEFEIEGLMIRGDEACAIAIPLNIDTDAPLITMRKGPNGWYGVEVGTGGEIPAWYEPYLWDL
jgi:hypothetical protein